MNSLTQNSEPTQLAYATGQCSLGAILVARSDAAFARSSWGMIRKA
jgi:hypothetical protein